jgi:recombinational DNA repair protein (RecF pathway)
MAPVTTRAILLRGHDYGDSSRILRFYTQGHGLLSVVARGVRRDVTRFAGASCLAELVLSHAHQEPHSEVFSALEAGLDRLALVDPAELMGAILASLWGLTEAFGFAPQLDPCVLCATSLGKDEVGRFDFAAGGVRCPSCAEGAAGPRIGPIARRQLRELLEGRCPSDFSHTRQHLGLVSDFIAYHVVSKPLKSFRILGELLPGESEVPA